MITAIAWLPMCTQWRKYAAGDIISSLTKLKKKLGPSWNSLSRFSKSSIKSICKIEESDNLSKLWDFF